MPIGYVEEPIDLVSHRSPAYLVSKPTHPHVNRQQVRSADYAWIRPDASLYMADAMIKEHDLVVAVEHLVLEALPKRLTEDALAASVGVELATLQQAFQAVRGASVYRAVLALRLALVAQILDEDGTRLPNLVARQCGFGYYGSFLRAYRQEFGCEPDRSRDTRPAARRASTVNGDRRPRRSKTRPVFADSADAEILNDKPRDDL